MAETQDNSEASYTGPSYSNRRTKNFLRAIRVYREALDEAQEDLRPRYQMHSVDSPDLSTWRLYLDKSMQALSLHDTTSLGNSDAIVKNEIWNKFVRQKESAKEIKLKPRESRDMKETLDRFFESQRLSKTIPAIKSKTQIETEDYDDETSDYFEIMSENTEEQSNRTLQNAHSTMEYAKSRTPRNNFQPWKDNLRTRHPDTNVPLEARLLGSAALMNYWISCAHHAVAQTGSTLIEEVVPGLLPDKQVGNGWKWMFRIGTDGEIPMFDPTIVYDAGLEGTRDAYFAAICSNFVFSFTSPGSLSAFVSTLAGSCWHDSDDLRLSIAVELNIFHPDGFEEGQELSAFVRTDVPHGWREATYEFETWMETLKELQQLPDDLRVKLCWWFPYRYYYNLREGTELLRIAENINFLEIDVKENSWAHVPQKHHNIAMFKFAITGERMAKRHEDYWQGMDAHEVLWLFDHGTLAVTCMEVLKEASGSSG